jgi:uncharacterized protein (TIGR03382 family)
VTQSAPASMDGGMANLTFQLTAPSSAGMVTLYAGVVSSNGDLAMTGDSTATTTLMVNVAAGGMDAGTGGTSSSGGGCSAGSTPWVSLLGLPLVWLVVSRRRRA